MSRFSPNPELLPTSEPYGGGSAALRPQTSTTWVVLLVLFLALILLAPLWIVKFPPLVDYPNHLARAFILAHFNDLHFHFREFYAPDWGFYPYIAPDAFLVGLQRLASVDVAGRILLSLSVLSVPLGAWLFVHEANPGQDHLALWSLLISYSTYFFYGWFNSVLSLGLCFLAVGLWLRYLARPRTRTWVLLLLLLTLLYFTHLLGFGMAGLLISGYAILARRKFAELLRSWLLFVPGFLFYAFSRLGPGRNWSIGFVGLKEKLIGLTSVVRGYSNLLDVVTVLVLAACLVAAWWRNSDFRWNRPWLIATAALFAVYWIFPAAFAGGAGADRRLLLFVFVLALATATVGRRARQLAVVAMLLFCLRTADVATQFVSAQPRLASLAHSFPVVGSDARILPLVAHTSDRSIQRDYFMFWAYGVIQQGWFSPYLFHLKGVQPLAIVKETYRPPGFWSMVYQETPDWVRVQRDYDYVWAFNARKFDADLKAIGQLVFEQGDLRVYRLEKPHSGP